MQNQLRRRRRRLDPGKNMLKQLLCAQKVTSKSSKGREKLQTYLKSRNSARSLHKSVIQAPSQLQKNTHTHKRRTLLSRAYTRGSSPLLRTSSLPQPALLSISIFISHRFIFDPWIQWLDVSHWISCTRWHVDSPRVKQMAVRFFRIRILAVASMSSVGGEGDVRGRREGQKGSRVQKKKNQTKKKKGLCKCGSRRECKAKNWKIKNLGSWNLSIKVGS